MCLDDNVVSWGPTCEIWDLPWSFDTEADPGITWPGRVYMIQEGPQINTLPDKIKVITLLLSHYKFEDTDIHQMAYMFIDLTSLAQKKIFHIQEIQELICVIDGYLYICSVHFIKFSTTWGCVSLPRNTTLSGWKLHVPIFAHSRPNIYNSYNHLNTHFAPDSGDLID